MKVFMKHPELVVGFSTIEDGNMSYKWGNAVDVESARRDYCNTIGIDVSKVVAVKLVYGTEIIKPSLEDAGKGMFPNNAENFKADGLITNILGLGLCFFVADCMPAVVYDQKNRAVALLHAGRHGVEQNILRVCLEKMATEYGTKPKDVILGAGPGISAESYVFDTDEGVDNGFWGDDLVLGDDKKFHMDNKNKLLKQAIELGIPKNQIEISSVDTYTSKDYFSHRISYDNGEPEGRFAAVAYLKK